MTSEAAPSAKPSSASPRPRRPWYMVVALMAAWLLGSGATMEGWTQMSLFKNGSLDDGPTLSSAADRTPDAQAIDSARRERMIEALFAAQKRMVPLSIASGVLGVSIWTFAVGAMAGRRGGRRLLVQVLLVHASLGVVAYILTPDVRRVEVAIDHEAQNDNAEILKKDSRFPPETVAEVNALGNRMAELGPALRLAFGLLAHAAVVVALTRKRTLAFYELAGS